MPGMIELKSFSGSIVIQILPINNHKKKIGIDKTVCWKYLIQLLYFEWLTLVPVSALLPVSLSA